LVISPWIIEEMGDSPPASHVWFPDSYGPLWPKIQVISQWKPPHWYGSVKSHFIIGKEVLTHRFNTPKTWWIIAIINQL
jgi:hypothetical protein